VLSRSCPIAQSHTVPHRPRQIDESTAARGQAVDALAEATLQTRLAYAGGLLQVHRDIVRCPDGHVTYANSCAIRAP